MRHHKILAVDDDPLNLEIIEELFAEEYTLTTASSGPEALEIAEKLRPDLVLLDIMMPGMDGYEVCKRIRSRETLKYTKVLLVSAKAMVSERLKGYESGADDYIVKPFDHAELGAKLRVFLRLKSMEETDEIKTQFLTLFAHETRTPLTQILALSDLISDQKMMDVETLSDMAGVLQTAASRLENLLERGHRLCELRAGHVTSSLEKFDFVAVCKDVIAQERVKAGRADTDFSIKTVASAPMQSDERRVREVAALVVEFLAKRAPKNELVRVALDTENGSPILSLSALLSGVNPETVGLLLEPFRVSNVNQHGGEGLLNIPLAAELVRHLQGSIEASSGPSGEVEIQIRFPQAIDAASENRGTIDSGFSAAA